MAKLETRRGYRPDHRSFGQFIRSEQARKPALEAAHDIKGMAEQLASDDVETGEYARSFKVNAKPANLLLAGNLRAITEVYNDDEAAPSQEFGRRNRKTGRRVKQGNRTLARAGHSAVGPVIKGGRI